MRSSQGNAHVLKDPSLNAIFIVLTQYYCAEEYANSFLDELRLNYSRDRSSATNKSSLAKICQKYNDIVRSDKAATAQEKIGATKESVKDAITNMIDAREQALVLDVTSHELNEESRRFNEGSTEYHRRMVWRSARNYLYLGGSLVIVVIVIWLIVK
eukprot:TRINITY_DN1701_c0_g2_i1.p1 TRINITY_DN1701_c0_g2~~TRINITY_DN1701_c0_g2_i1.p1  ORF type:complete len:157 (-),score=48.14 TRINITY_DN1701_c0_g2_i1:42-512(-)